MFTVLASLALHSVLRATNADGTMTLTNDACPYRIVKQVYPTSHDSWKSAVIRQGGVEFVYCWAYGPPTAVMILQENGEYTILERRGFKEVLIP